MGDPRANELEAEVRQRVERGDVDGAATGAIRGYGPAIFSLLASLHRSEQEASDVFSLFTEGVWRGLGTFAWQCSLRTWLYAIARKASLRYRRDARRHGARVTALPEGSEVAQLAEQIRSETLPYLRTKVRSRIAQLRDALPPDDQMLLVLRVERELSWNELATVLRGEDEEPLEGDALKREAARLRKRFQLVKDELRERGRAEGLLENDPNKP
jgi:RNA polymerase sigma-70 factor (ECF subfamily)